jgi:hypothetical protein
MKCKAYLYNSIKMLNTSLFAKLNPADMDKKKTHDAVSTMFRSTGTTTATKQACSIISDKPSFSA